MPLLRHKGQLRWDSCPITQLNSQVFIWQINKKEFTQTESRDISTRNFVSNCRREQWQWAPTPSEGAEQDDVIQLITNNIIHYFQMINLYIHIHAIGESFHLKKTLRGNLCACSRYIALMLSSSVRISEPSEKIFPNKPLNKEKRWWNQQWGWI